MLEVFFLPLVGFIVGMILSTIGSGAGMIGTPLLTFTLKIPIHDAILISLASGSITTSFYTLKAIKSKRIEWRYAIPIGIISLFFAPLGAKFSLTFSQYALSIVFGILMLGSSYVMWKRSRQENIIIVDAKDVRPYKYIFLVLITMCISTLGGMAGAGGIIFVPFLVTVMGTNMRTATALSVFFVTITASTATVSHLMMNRDFNIPYIAIYSAGSIIGMLIGSKISLSIPDRQLRKIFSLVISIAGAVMLLTNLVKSGIISVPS